jgi:CRP/FNR family transcriptional regulator, cyclic AMP receptor protein
MRLSEVAGYLASALVVMAFCMRDIVPLRLVAIGSNIAFIIYGIGLGLVPVCLLHAMLLPINSWRLWQAISRLNLRQKVRRNGRVQPVDGPAP